MSTSKSFPSLSLSLSLSLQDFTKNFFKSTLLTSFPELEGTTRKDFFTEYIERVKAQTKPVRNTIRLGLSKQTFLPSLFWFLFSKRTLPLSLLPGRRWILRGFCGRHSSVWAENKRYMISQNKRYMTNWSNENIALS